MLTFILKKKDAKLLWLSILSVVFALPNEALTATLEGQASIQEKYRISADTTSCPYDASIYSPIEISFVGPDLTHSGTLNTELSLREIRSTVKNRGFINGDRVVAFADIEYGVAYDFSTRSFKLPNQSVECHWVDAISIQFVFKKPPTVLIPSELESSKIEDGGVCFDQVFAHEMQHVRDYEKVFEDIVVQVDQDRRFHPRNLFPSKHQTLEVDILDGDPNAGNTVIKEMLTSHYEPIVNQTMAEIKRNIRYLASILDSTDEYERITEYCRTVLNKID